MNFELMHLRRLLEYLIELGNIPREEIIWDEVKWFEENHKDHGIYSLHICEDKGGKVESIIGECNPINLPYGGEIVLSQTGLI